MAKVFVSHSAKEDDAGALLDALEAGLKAAGYDVLLDRTRLAAGDDWRGKLSNWLEECHAGLVLLSPNAVTRPWVIAEATVLMQRKTTQPGFTVIPIFVPPASAADIRDNPSWGPANLAGIQGLTAENAVSVLAELQPLLEPVLTRYGARSPTYDLELALAARLRPMDEQSLERAAEELNVNLTGWVRGTEKRFVLAQRALGAELEALYKFADRLIQLSLDPESARYVYEAAVPYAWVDPVAASRIVEISARPTPRAAGLNSAQLLTCEMYVRRAHHEWKPCTIHGGWTERALDEVIGLARRALKKAAWGDEDAAVDDVALNADLADDRYFLIVPAPLPDAELAARLLQAFPSVTFLFLAGATSQADFAARALPGVDYLQPEVDPEREAEVLRIYDRDIGRLRAAG
jgi:hypothetical protein